MSVLLPLILVLLVLWIIGNIFTYLLQDYFILRPKRLPATYAYSFTGDFEEIFLSTADEGKLNALWFKIPNPKGVILFFHGNADNLARWGHLHHYFAQYGYDFFVYDYRGYGKSTGPRTEKTLYQDAMAVYQYLVHRYQADQIVLFGRSLGCAFATKIASEKLSKRVILETPFYSMPNLFYTYYPFFPRVFWFKYVLSNCKHIKKIDQPICILQGTKDFVVPFRCAQRLQRCLKAEDQFVTIPGGGHNNLLFYDIYNRKMQALLKQ